MAEHQQKDRGSRVWIIEIPAPTETPAGEVAGLLVGELKGVRQLWVTNIAEQSSFRAVVLFYRKRYLASVRKAMDAQPLLKHVAQLSAHKLNEVAALGQGARYELVGGKEPKIDEMIRAISERAASTVAIVEPPTQEAPVLNEDERKRIFRAGFRAGVRAARKNGGGS